MTTRAMAATQTSYIHLRLGFIYALLAAMMMLASTTPVGAVAVGVMGSEGMVVNGVATGKVTKRVIKPSGSSGSSAQGTVTPVQPSSPSNDQYAAIPVSPIAPNSPYLLQQFAVFDATEFRGKPDTRGLGFKVVKSVYEWDIYQYDRSMLIPKTGIVAAARAAKGTGAFRMSTGQADLYMLDVERIPVADIDERTKTTNLDNLRSSYWLFKRHVGDGRPVGYYAFTPHQRPYAAVSGASSPSFRTWQSDTDGMAMLTRQLDVLMPSAYTHSPDTNFWVRGAEAQVAEARRVRPDAKVYLVLMPVYFDLSPAGGTELPPAFWRLQLETAKRIADGTIIWMVNHQADWNPNARWWQTTLQFMRDHGLSPGA